MAVIEVENLVKQYKRTKQRSVDNVSFQVQEGEFFAFLGPNGAGKTTTISILTTTLAKTAGQVRIAGYDIDAQDRLVRQEIGIIFQQPNLDRALTAEQNIRIHACLFGMYAYRPAYRLMPASYRQRVEHLADIVGVSESLFTKVSRLSGGMQRKFEVVRSLVHTPHVLFLDEPTQGLDAVSRHDLWDYLNRVRREWGTTIFLTTHYIDEAEAASTVCLINQGQIVLCCPPQEMKQRLGAATLEEAYVDFLRSQDDDPVAAASSGGRSAGSRSASGRSAGGRRGR
ncbi:MAG: ATP-binding cassette domain-containing protein [Bifidobacteriaceae bacterium]|jgi:ABC-2 type transport system ATP-binding protein|nr:ATP-binding cassette domain-containing protein [Bifidobacteriaceae bacterium]